MTDFPTHSHTSTSETPTLSYTRSLIRYPIRAEPAGIGDYREYPRNIPSGQIQHDCHADVPLLSETKMPTSGDKKPGDSLFCTTALIVTHPPTPLPHKFTHPPNYDMGIYEVLHEVHTTKILFHHCKRVWMELPDYRQSYWILTENRQVDPPIQTLL